MTPSPAPKRRRFRWSLRTMFVVVTMLCVWLGYELNWIRERGAFFASGFAAEGPEIRAPAFLWIFGEPGYSLIMVQGHGYDESVRAKRLFPEARIVCSGPEFD